MQPTLKTIISIFLLAFLTAGNLITSNAQAPGTLQLQSRILVGTTPFTGTGEFKFALVNADGSTTFWSNDGSSASGSEPAAAVSLPVAQGLYSVQLGDAAITGMTSIPATVFTNTDVRLRVWFDDGATGSQQLSPDQRIASVGYALNAARAESVAEGAITSASIAGVLSSGQIPSLDASKITSGTLNVAHLPAFILTNGGSGVTLSGTFSGDGSGLAIPGVIPWQTVSGTEQAGQPNTAYLLTNDTVTIVTMPSRANLGDVITVSGLGAGGWAVHRADGAAGSAPWVARGISGNWNSVASSADGSKLVAVGMGYVYTSTDGGVSWTPRAHESSWASVASSADGSNLAAVEYGGFIHTSTDSGVTWTARTSDIMWWNTVASSSDGSKLVATVDYGYIHTSTDSGETWTAQEGIGWWESVASSADGTKLVAVEYGGFIHTSTDSGVTWTVRTSDIEYWTSVASSADGSKLVAAADEGQIHTSTDSGETWTPRESDRWWESVASSADGTKLVAAAYSGQIYTSKDSGETWTAEASDQDWVSVASSADGTRLVAAVADGEVYTWDQELLLSGYQGTTTTLQYVGNGIWQPQTGVADVNVALRSGGNKFSGDQTFTGNVGIGQLSPFAKLHVEGDVFAAGVVAAFSFFGDGSGLTEIDAGSITSGTLDAAHLPESVVMDGASELTLGGTFSGDGSGLTNVASLSAGNYFSGDQVIASGRLAIGEIPPGGIVKLQVTGDDSNWKGGAAFGGSAAAVIIGETNGVAQIAGHNADLLAWSDLAINSGGGNVGVGVLAPAEKLHVDGNILATGTITGSSDRNLKENFAAIHPQEILDKVTAIPLTRWNYKSDPQVSHVGPMAQDFHAAFSLGKDDRHISMVDADGIALAAIQGLNQIVRAQAAQLAELEKANAALIASQKQADERFAALEKLLLGASRESVEPAAQGGSNEIGARP